MIKFKEIPESIKTLRENLATLRALSGWLPASSENFETALEVFTDNFPKDKEVPRIDERFQAIESFVGLPDILKEWVNGIEDDRVWNSDWIANSSWVLSEAWNLMEVIDALVIVSVERGEAKAKELGEQAKGLIKGVLNEADLPEPKGRFASKPEVGVITNAHEKIKHIMSFMNNFLQNGKEKGHVNYFNALLNQKGKQKVSLANAGESNDDFSRAVEALNKEEEAPEDSNDLIRHMAERFEQLSSAGRRNAKSFEQSINSLLGSLKIPLVRSKMKLHPTFRRRISQFTYLAEAFSEIAKEMSSLSDEVLKLKNISGKKNQQAIWNKTRELIKKSFTNRSSDMGGGKREISVQSMIDDLKQMNEILHSSRMEVSPQYRNAQSRSTEKEDPETEDSSSDEPPTPVRTPPDPDEPVPPKSPGVRKDKPENPKMPDGSESYTTEQAIKRLGLKSTLEFKDLMDGVFSKSIRKFSIGSGASHKNYYSKDDIEKIAKSLKGAPPEMPPEDTDTELPEKEEISSSSSEKPSTPESPVEKEIPPESEPTKSEEPPVPPRHEPDWGAEEDDAESDSAAQAFNKKAEDQGLIRRLQKSGITQMPNFQHWIMGDIPESHNPLVFYMALRGKGDKLATGKNLQDRVLSIFKGANQFPQQNPWVLLKAYEKLINLGIDSRLTQAPHPEEIGKMLATNIPQKIKDLARSGALIKTSIFRGPKPTEELERIKKWLTKIDNPYFRHLAANEIMAEIPNGLRKYLFNSLGTI